MTPDPVCATPQTTLFEAHQIMKDNRIRRLPVVRKGKLLGIVTLGDIRGARPSEATSLSVYEINYLLDRLTLDHTMSKNPVTVAPDTTIGEAARTMLQHKIGGLPVVELGQVVGIITESDIFRMVAGMWEKESLREPEYA